MTVTGSAVTGAVGSRSPLVMEEAGPEAGLRLEREELDDDPDLIDGSSSMLFEIESTGTFTEDELGVERRLPEPLAPYW